jgi:hypothetical protein
LAALFGGLGGVAAWQWRSAERARKEADKARAAAQVARSEAENARENVERFEYGRAIEVAYREWRDNNVPATLALLAGTRANLRGWEWRYLNRLCHLELLTIIEKTKMPAMGGDLREFRSAVFSPDGSRILTTTADGLTKEWDATRGTEILAFQSHVSEYASSRFNNDGSQIVTTSSDGTT